MSNIKPSQMHFNSEATLLIPVPDDLCQLITIIGANASSTVGVLNTLTPKISSDWAFPSARPRGGLRILLANIFYVEEGTSRLTFA
jgi:hypothetical protein